MLTGQLRAISDCLELCLLARAASCSAHNSPSLQDEQIEQERVSQHISGGCCALAAVYLMGKFYVANAGDSRYVWPQPALVSSLCCLCVPVALRELQNSFPTSGT